jgi:COMPASS component BRE2
MTPPGGQMSDRQALKLRPTGEDGCTAASSRHGKRSTTCDGYGICAFRPTYETHSGWRSPCTSCVLPLNPDVASSRSRKGAAPREQREKKESLKKRESKATSVVGDARGGTPEVNSSRRKLKTTSEAVVMSPTRYKLPPPKLMDFEAPKAPVLLPHHTIGDTGLWNIRTVSLRLVLHVQVHRLTTSQCLQSQGLPLRIALLTQLFLPHCIIDSLKPNLTGRDSTSKTLHLTSYTTSPERLLRPRRAFAWRERMGVREGKWYWNARWSVL